MNVHEARPKYAAVSFGPSPSQAKYLCCPKFKLCTGTNHDLRSFRLYPSRVYLVKVTSQGSCEYIHVLYVFLFRYVNRNHHRDLEQIR